MQITLESFSADTFEALLGTRIGFLRPPDALGRRERVELELIAIGKPGYGQPEGGQPGQRLRRSPFSLLFTMRDREPLGMGLHRLDQPGFEACELMISRVTVPELERGDGTMYFEAVFW